MSEAVSARDPGERSPAPDFDPLRLVPFAPEHERAIVGLIAAVYAEYRQQIELDTLDEDLRRIPEVYHGPECAFWVLLDGDRPVGTVAVKHAPDGDAELKRVFLHPSRRGLGIGRRLVLWAFEWARARGHARIHIWSDVLFRTSHSMYRSLGAEDTGRRRVLGGINHVEEFYFSKTL